MKRKRSVYRVVSFACLLLACFAGAGCPSNDDESKAVDGGSQVAKDAGDEQGGGEDEDASASRDEDAATDGEIDAGGIAADGGEVTDAETAAVGDDAVVEGGDISGPAALHVEISNAKASNVITDDEDSNMPGGSSAINQGVRGTSLYANISGAGGTSGITLFLNGALKPGATFELVDPPYNASVGKGYLQMMQSSTATLENHTWRAKSGTVTIEAVKGNSVKLSSGKLSMGVADSNAPNNSATGTFDATLTALIMNIGGIE